MVCIYLNLPVFMGTVLDDTSGEAVLQWKFLVCVCTYLYKQVTYFLEA